MIRVSAGIIRRQDGKILICRRGEGRKNAHLWEFPGGKQEENESPADCLQRELQEELSLAVEKVRLVCTEEAQGIRFDFLSCQALNEPTLKEHEAKLWVSPREMLYHRFCPADSGVAQRIALTQAPIRAVLWDFDGTLMDTYPAMVRAMHSIVQDMGASCDLEEIALLMKVSMLYCARVIGARYSLDSGEIARLFRAREKGAAESLPVAGIPEVLQTLKDKGVHHYLVTHRDCSAFAGLDAAGLDGYFSGGITAEDNLPRKPEPDMVLAALLRFGIDKSEAVMIGDRPLDVRAALQCGVAAGLLDPENAFPSEPCTFRFLSAADIAAQICPDEIGL